MDFLYYRFYSLLIASQFPLSRIPQLSEPSTPPDVVIHDQAFPYPEGRVPTQEFRAHVATIGFLTIRDGREIIVEREAGSSDALLRSFLVGISLSVILHQRGLLPLHASSIAASEGAVLFCGDSGAGKSTLAMGFHRLRNYPLISDDICVVREEKGLPVAYPSAPEVKLWMGSLSMLMLQDQQAELIQPDVDKYALPLSEAFVTNPYPVHALYVLNWKDEGDAHLEPITGMHKLIHLQQQIFRPELQRLVQPVTIALPVAAAFLQNVRMVKVWRTRQESALQQVVELIEQDFVRVKASPHI